ncbi:hypothetical protein K6U06_00665 [Acidiferrimicrobium sp. IK]|uniref:hypothetical protein n=1 Tax=Acidiferrimicrobium sp. IK TaxID=2871700 RepID=UPI0021CB18F9|nr:hypothetical protein [Acidiferrimicrobium sp. IK]MCU4182858.1 hypothetical protein [Acidiferrimicrobium sp. IK]
MDWRRWVGAKHREDEVVTEAARLIDGTTYDANFGSGRYVRPWTVVGALAHCDLGRLAQLRTLPPSTPTQSWRATLAYLATELATKASTASDLARLQREVLVPLELELLARGNGWMSCPSELIDLFSGELASYQRRSGG